MQSNYNVTIGFGFCIKDIPMDILENINFKHIRNLIDKTVNFKQFLLDNDLYPTFLKYPSGSRKPETDDYAILESNSAVYLSTQDWFIMLAETIMDINADFQDGIGIFCSEIMSDIAETKGFSKNLMILVFDDDLYPCVIFPKKFIWDISENDRSITLDMLTHDIIYPVLSAIDVPEKMIFDICDTITIVS